MCRLQVHGPWRARCMDPGTPSGMLTQVVTSRYVACRCAVHGPGHAWRHGDGGRVVRGGRAGDLQLHAARLRGHARQSHVRLQRQQPAGGLEPAGPRVHRSVP